MTKFSCLLTAFICLSLLFLSPVFSQSAVPEGTEGKLIDWNHIHFAGIAYQQSFKKMDVESVNDAHKLEYSIDSLGINYASFNGSRLGFNSDLYILIPYRSRRNSASHENNSGISVDYMGSVAWNLWTGSFGFLPYIGFHSQYTFLNRDPLDENQSNHMLSFGMGIGLKFILKLNEKNNLYIGIKGSRDSIEFTSASYDSREIQLQNKNSYMISAGYAYTAAVKKRLIQSNVLE